MAPYHDPQARAADRLQVALGAAAPDDWEELVASDPDADFFHTRAWTDAVAATYPNRTALWMTVRAGERLVAGLAAVERTGRRVELVESSLEGTSGGPVVAGDLPADFAETLARLLLDRFHDLRGGLLSSLSVSLNSGHERRFGDLLREDSRWMRHDHPAAVVPLEGGIEVVEHERLNRTKRKERNRAERGGVEVSVTRDPGRVAAYYPVYLEAAANWGVEPAPLELLQALLAIPETRDLGRGAAFFTCVELEGRVIGGHLNLVYGDRVVAWSGVTDPRFARSHFPATAAICNDLEEACRRGASRLDLGGSGGSSNLETFKKAFGAVEETRGWYTSDTSALRLLRAVRRLLPGRGARSGAGRS